MQRVHPEILEAEQRLEELKAQEQRATGKEKADLVVLVNAQAQMVDELRWQHTPRPMVTRELVEAAQYTEEIGEDRQGLQGERAYVGGASS
jgi:hypothetical protein